MKKTLMILMMMVVTLMTATPVTVEAKSVKPARYTTEVAVVGFNTNTTSKEVCVLYGNGKTHIFKSDLAKRYKVGQIIKVHNKTNRTKSVKDDVVLDIYKWKPNHSELGTLARCYSQDYRNCYLTWKNYKKHEAQNR